MAGPYLPQYDVYYKKLDVDGKGEIGAMEAATFLKKSGLSDEMLGKVIRFLISCFKVLEWARRLILCVRDNYGANCF